MKDTSCGESCPFVKCGICESEKGCPNYAESWWIKGNSEEPVLIKDCAPKRMLVQQQVLQSKLEFVQGALEQSRNEFNELSGYFKAIVSSCKTVLEKKLIGVEDEQIGIDYSDDGSCK